MGQSADAQLIYGSAPVERMKMEVLINEAKPRILRALREMNAPSDLVPGIFLLSSYS
jgi:hypothetical protein